MRTTFAIFTVLAVTAFATAQEIPFDTLRIGDKAPAFKPTSAVKGKYINSFQKGKTYVIEFWATWCGACIAVMPHFSDLADKYKGKVDFVSVNTMNYSEKGVQENLGDHTKRVSDWVSRNSDKMRYNSLLDDEKDTIYKNWAEAAGYSGIPFSFIVDGEGRIAWVGHPVNVDKPLEAVLAKTWDIKAFRDQYEKINEGSREAKTATPKIISSIKAKDFAKVVACIDGAKHKREIFYITLYRSTEVDPNLAAQLVKKYDVNDGLEFDEWYMLCDTFLLPKLSDATSKSYVVKVSENKANEAKASDAARRYAYHARFLVSAGDKVEAKLWIEKARKALEQYEPAGDKGRIVQFIEVVEKDVKG